MRVSIVPAQITTVEDKIAGNLSVQQGGLLVVPILLGFLIAILFPPSGQFVTYKLVIVGIILLICATLAIRIKDRIIAQWIHLFIVYTARPQYYVSDKNTSYLRNKWTAISSNNEKVTTQKAVKRSVVKRSEIPQHEYARLERMANELGSKMKYTVGKDGRLNVQITENE
jgi:hypothetical protein